MQSVIAAIFTFICMCVAIAYICKHSHATKKLTINHQQVIGGICALFLALDCFVFVDLSCQYFLRDKPQSKIAQANASAMYSTDTKAWDRTDEAKAKADKSDATPSEKAAYRKAEKHSNHDDHVVIHLLKKETQPDLRANRDGHIFTFYMTHHDHKIKGGLLK